MPQDYDVNVHDLAVEDISALSPRDQRQAIILLKRLTRPSAVGESLGHHGLDLAGCRRLVNGRLRVVFEVDDAAHSVSVLSVRVRKGGMVYEVTAPGIGARRLQKLHTLP